MRKAIQGYVLTGVNLRLDGLWPYWMPRPTKLPEASSGPEHSPLHSLERSVHATTANDVDVGDGLLLLTGANMSGKSTIMRSVMAAALLANVGLPVPCHGASVPWVCSK
jgi:hypothetical protein